MVMRMRMRLRMLMRITTGSMPERGSLQTLSAISTSQLHVLLRMHCQPINVVVYYTPPRKKSIAISHLISFQRFIT